MIETCRLKNVVIFIQTILSFVLSRKIIDKCIFDKNDSLVTHSSFWRQEAFHNRQQIYIRSNNLVFNIFRKI